MKLKKVLTIAGVIYPLAYDETHLSFKNAGRASFTIESDQPTTGIVTLDIGYDSPLKRFFTGYVESCTQTNTNEFKVFCREFTGILKEPLALNLRHCTLKDLAKEMANKTGLTFTVANAAYSNTPAAFFYNIGTGHHALDSIDQVFNIKDYLWQQEDNGSVFIGSWADSYWAAVGAIEIPIKLFKDYQSTGIATVGCIPVLRPGALLNNGGRIQSIILTGEEMTIRWKKS